MSRRSKTRLVLAVLATLYLAVAAYGRWHYLLPWHQTSVVVHCVQAPAHVAHPQPFCRPHRRALS